MAGQEPARRGIRRLRAVPAVLIALAALNGLGGAPYSAAAQIAPTLTPARLVFPSVAAGTTGAGQPFKFAASSPVTVDAVSVVGEFSLLSTDCTPTPPAPVASCVASVAFSPTTAGAKTGTLTVAAAGSTLTSSLSGQATAPATTVATTSTTGPPRTTSTTSPPTTSSTRPPSTSTTRGPTTTTTSTSVPETTLPPETVPPPTTVVTPTTLPPGPGGGPTLDAVAAHGARSGPPGIGVTVSGTGYGPATGTALVLIAYGSAAEPGCGTVYLFVDGQRIGSVRPGAAGDIRRTGLSVPGDTSPGRHHVASACQPSGSPVLASTPFDVTDAAVHRTALATSLPRVADVDFGAGRLLASAVAAVGLLLLIAFPAELFNTTLEEHYDEVRGWFRLRPRGVAGGRHHGALLVLFLLLSGPLWFSMQASSGIDRATAVGALGLSVATAVVVLASDLPEVLHVRRRYAERAAPVVLPGSLLMALACVVLSRAVHFQPGYFYGLIGGLALARSLGRDESGRLAAWAAAGLLALSIVSWVVLQPVAAAARETGTSLPAILAENVLGGIFWAALDTLVIALLPLRLLEGAKVVGWSRRAWAVLYGVTLLAFVHILLRPGSGYVSNSSVSPRSVVIGLFVGFAAFSVAFWGYFRFRPPSADLGEPLADEVEGAAGAEPPDVLLGEGVAAGEVQRGPVGPVEPAGDRLIRGQAVEPQD